LDIPGEKKLAGLGTYGPPFMTSRNSGVMSLIISDVKHIADHDLIITHLLKNEENMLAKSFTMTVVSWAQMDRLVLNLKICK
jgi:hypothetical protein